MPEEACNKQSRTHHALLVTQFAQRLSLPWEHHETLSFIIMKTTTVVVCSLFLGLTLGSCDWTKNKAKASLHKGGEIVGKGGSEVADGVAKGVEESFSNLVETSPGIKSSGIKLGQIKVMGTDSTRDNVVSVYLIFDKRFAGKMTAKAIHQNGLEFGRTSIDIAADAGEAKFVDFVFDKRTNLDRTDRVMLE